MSKGFWQTKRQTEQFGNGGSISQRVTKYVKTWENRCYSEGIPDEVPPKLAKANRAPSWKQIAILILQNDHQLRGLGFGREESELVDQIYRERMRMESGQIGLFQ